MKSAKAFEAKLIFRRVVSSILTSGFFETCAQSNLFTACPPSSHPFGGAAVACLRLIRWCILCVVWHERCRVVRVAGSSAPGILVCLCELRHMLCGTVHVRSIPLHVSVHSQSLRFTRKVRKH